MATFALNEQHDIFLDTNGNIAVVEGEDEIAQNIKCALLLKKGEYKYNTELGFQWTSSTGALLPDIAFKKHIQDTVLNINGICSVSNIRITPDNQSVNISLEYRINNGVDKTFSLKVPLN